MTKQLRVAIEIIINCLEKSNKVLEIGSRQAIKQNELADFRGLFGESKYVGMDMQAGPGVDIVANAEKIPFADNSFDVVMSLETLEHAQKPWVVATEMERVLKPNGILIVSSPQNFPIHNHPSDYFRYTPFGLKAIFPHIPQKLVFGISPPFNDEVKLNPQQVVLVATSTKNKKILTKIRRSLIENKAKISSYKPLRHRLYDASKILNRAWNELFYRLEIEFFK